jgi:hypothetical protein
MFSGLPRITDVDGVLARSPASKRYATSGLPALRRLANLEPLKLRVPKIEGLVTASARVGCTECLRLGPRFKASTVLPDRVRSMKRVILKLRGL